MQLRYHRRFQKQFKKLSAAKQQVVYERIALFVENPDHPLLLRHGLKGRYLHHFSLNVGGDLRVVYRYHDDKIVEFMALGTHSQLY